MTLFNPNVFPDNKTISEAEVDLISFNLAVKLNMGDKDEE